MRVDDSFNSENPSYNLNSNFKSTFLLLLLTFSLFLLFPLISSAEIQFSKNSSDFNQGETIIAKVSGNFLEPVTTSNVFFYRGNVQIPIVYDVGKAGNDFYIYAITTGKNSGNYSISLEGVEYMNGPSVSNTNIIKNFTINQNSSDFSVNPGFINNEGDFSLEVQNLKESQITININSPGSIQSQDSINLISGDSETLNFFVVGERSGSETIKLTSGNTEYFLPILVTSTLPVNETTNDTGTSNNTNNIDEEDSTSGESFKFEPNSINVSIATDSSSKRIVYLVNTGDSDVEDIIFLVSSSISPYVTIKSSSTLDEDSTERVEIIVTSSEDSKIIIGDITAKTEKESSSIEVTLNFIEDYVAPADEEVNEDGEVIVTTCLQLSGNKCSENEICNGEVVMVRDGFCCLSTCGEVRKASSAGKIVGWILLILVVIFLLWFFKRYKSVRPKTDLLNVGKK